jgi:hypothetical protein
MPIPQSKNGSSDQALSEYAAKKLRHEEQRREAFRSLDGTSEAEKACENLNMNALQRIIKTYNNNHRDRRMCLEGHSKKTRVQLIAIIKKAVDDQKITLQDIENSTIKVKMYMYTHPVSAADIGTKVWWSTRSSALGNCPKFGIIVNHDNGVFGIKAVEASHADVADKPIVVDGRLRTATPVWDKQEDDEYIEYKKADQVHIYYPNETYLDFLYI